jgi:hypothetical protein
MDMRLCFLGRTDQITEHYFDDLSFKGLANTSHVTSTLSVNIETVYLNVKYYKMFRME